MGTDKLLLHRKRIWVATIVFFVILVGVNWFITDEKRPHRILLDTDVDTDDLLALLYLLKVDQSEFKLEAVTISANGWSDAGHAVNHIYDILYMMGRDDVSVGVGGEGGILEDGTILPNVGGYLPIIEQGKSTAGYCRYRQAIPVGSGGRLDVDSNFGIRKAFLPRGSRKYSPLRQPTTQEVLIDKISAGPTTVLLTGTLTNFAIFLMSSSSDLKKNVEQIYIMGGGSTGNLFTYYHNNPYAEFNIFEDPFAAYQVIHSGIPITLVPLDATNTIPLDENFFNEFELNQRTFEAQYCFQSLKMIRDTWPDSGFYANYFMWDSFAAGIAVSRMHSSNKNIGDNEFAEMEYMNITVVTSNEQFGINDGSNAFFHGHTVPKFNLKKDGVHSGHVQTGLRDQFCTGHNGKGRCKDGYTEKVTSSEAVHVLVATKAKPHKDTKSRVGKAFFKSFLDVLNSPQQNGKFNFTMQFPYYKEVLYKPDFGSRRLGKAVVFDMDMSAGDFLALLYLLKVPAEVIDLKAIIVSPTGWANAATIDVVYDLLHMMGRDDVPVGLGDVFAMNQSDALFSAVGDCKYVKAVPHGSGGFLDSDTVYGLARNLPRSPRRYTAQKSARYETPRKTDHPEFRQPLALEIWESTLRTLEPGSKITLLTNGPLTNLAKIILLSGNDLSTVIQDVYIVGGHIINNTMDRGNVLNIHSNHYSEMNMFLDPLAAKTVFESSLNITLIPLGIQRRVSSFPEILERLQGTKQTPEALFAHGLLSSLYRLQQSHYRYHHMDTFLGEILGAAILAGNHSLLNPTFQVKPTKIVAEGVESEDGQTQIDVNQGKLINILENVDYTAYYAHFAYQLGTKNQSAATESFDEQGILWSIPPN